MSPTPRVRRSWAPSAILLRDILRASRRWQTYAARVAFSALLIGIGLTTILLAATTRAHNAADSAQLGRAVFIGIGTLQTLVATVAAPLLVSRGIIEEREDRTIEVLMLTGLTSRQVVHSKLLSRLLHLVTLVMGALPLLALAMTLGGVSPVEVVAVTAHALIATLVMGSLGAYFGVHTRVPLLATGGALAVGIPAFLLAPLVHTTLTMSATASAQVSPFFGGASQDWTSTLPVLFYLPMVLLTLRLTTQMFDLRVSGGRLRNVYSPTLWRGRRTAWLGLFALIGLFTVVPVVGLTSCAHTVAGSSTGPVPAAATAAWLWEVLAGYVLWWGALRVLTDVVLVADESFTAQGLRRQALGQAPPAYRNPVRWREIGPRAWRSTLPGAVAWTLGLVVVFQAGLWLLPGGLLALGAIQALAALVVGMWLGVGTIETERSSGSLTLLLASTLSSWQILWPKLLGALLPASVMLALAVPMIGLGLPYLQLAIDEELHGLEPLRGLFVCLWLLPLLPCATLAAMLIALGVRTPRSAYAVTLGVAATTLVAPLLAAVLLPKGNPLMIPLTWAIPVLDTRAPPQLLALSACGIAVTAMLLVAVLTRVLRPWGLRHA